MKALSDYGALTHFIEDGDGWWEARDQADLALNEIDRLRAQLESVRAELAATVANIAAWDDVLADVIPVLNDQMGND